MSSIPQDTDVSSVTTGSDFISPHSCPAPDTDDDGEVWYHCTAGCPQQPSELTNDGQYTRGMGSCYSPTTRAEMLEQRYHRVLDTVSARLEVEGKGLLLPRLQAALTALKASAKDLTFTTIGEKLSEMIEGRIVSLQDPGTRPCRSAYKSIRFSDGWDELLTRDLAKAIIATKDTLSIQQVLTDAYCLLAEPYRCAEEYKDAWPSLKYEVERLVKLRGTHVDEAMEAERQAERWAPVISTEMEEYCDVEGCDSATTAIGAEMSENQGLVQVKHHDEWSALGKERWDCVLHFSKIIDRVKMAMSALPDPPSQETQEMDMGRGYEESESPRSD